jgi:hypothetical protein
VVVMGTGVGQGLCRSSKDNGWGGWGRPSQSETMGFRKGGGAAGRSSPALNQAVEAHTRDTAVLCSEDDHQPPPRSFVDNQGPAGAGRRGGADPALEF